MPDEITKHEIDIVERSYQGILTILDSIDALIYVADMDTYELLFINEYGKSIWGDIQGQICWQALQQGQEGPCSFCTNDKLLNKDNQPSEVYVWEFQNTINNCWYQCRDKAIQWVDGRIVRMEIATDITDRKHAEEALKEAKQRAEQLANIDDLTGLNNRRAFFTQGHRAFQQAKRFGHAISVIMMDIDHFKQINDTYGHSVGDDVLQAISKPLQTLSREIDIIGRMGGEEFAFILPETGIDEAACLAERLRSEIEKIKTSHGVHIISVTASFGVVTYNNDKDNLESLITKADDALYVAKKKGRNQIRKHQ
ncbi:MAG: GGDEF domain-containing protein [Gammaproteobacteria bacterium]|nr:GGDEF domain-containing protein [Gammaproteobacteria bacterium]MDH5734823.1 GGDEF domain-containing protein [Gammaproteobacteria bacterium]